MDNNAFWNGLFDAFAPRPMGRKEHLASHDAIDINRKAMDALEKAQEEKSMMEQELWHLMYRYENLYGRVALDEFTKSYPLNDLRKPF